MPNAVKRAAKKDPPEPSKWALLVHGGSAAPKLLSDALVEVVGLARRKASSTAARAAKDGCAEAGAFKHEIADQMKADCEKFIQERGADPKGILSLREKRRSAS